MAMQSQGLRQVQKQTQNLVLAPQLRQSLKILQVPALELRSAILEELQTNPLLEEVGTNDESLDAENSELSPDEPADAEGEEFPDDPPEKEESDSDGNDDWEEDTPEDLMDMDFSDEFSILKEMQEDLREHFEREYEGEAQLGNSEAEEKRKFFFDSLVAETSLQEHLLDQLKMAETTHGQREACEYLIGTLDENGFLTTELSEIGLLSGLPLKDLQDALQLLQSFDPVGIAAFDLQDCLLKQMESRGWEESIAYRMVKEFFPLLVRRRVPELARKLSQPTQVIHQTLQKISELDPAPGRRFSEDTNQAVAADAEVEKVGKEWIIHLNNDYVPGFASIKFTRNLSPRESFLPKKKNMYAVKCGQVNSSSIQLNKDRILLKGLHKKFWLNRKSFSFMVHPNFAR